MVAADSATAALLSAGLAGLAAAGSERYVALAGTVALMVAALLVLARVVGLGFLANFLSRTVLVGFLTGVGVTVAIGQLGDLLGVDPGTGDAPERLVHVLSELPHAHLPTVLVGGAVILSCWRAGRSTRGYRWRCSPWSRRSSADAVLGLTAFGVAVLGPVPSGIPGLALPALAPADLAAAFPLAASMVVVILAQSAATARAYAARFDEQVDTDADLLALGGANLAAALTGTFVVNGSPTKTQMVVGAGGRSQVAQLAASSWSASCARWPPACWAGCRWPRWPPSCSSSASNSSTWPGCGGSWPCGGPSSSLRCSPRWPWWCSASRRGSSSPSWCRSSITCGTATPPAAACWSKSPAGHWRSLPVAPGARTAEGLLVYRFGSGLYFANVSRLVADLVTIGAEGPPVRWLCLDAAAVGDVDYTAAAVLTQLVQREQRAGVRVVLSNVVDGVPSRARPLRHRGADRRGRHLRHLRRGARGVRGARLAQTADPFCHCAHDSSQSP